MFHSVLILSSIFYVGMHDGQTHIGLCLFGVQELWWHPVEMLPYLQSRLLQSQVPQEWKKENKNGPTHF